MICSILILERISIKCYYQLLLFLSVHRSAFGHGWSLNHRSIHAQLLPSKHEINEKLKRDEIRSEHANRNKVWKEWQRPGSIRISCSEFLFFFFRKCGSGQWMSFDSLYVFSLLLLLFSIWLEEEARERRTSHVQQMISYVIGMSNPWQILCVSLLRKNTFSEFEREKMLLLLRRHTKFTF